MARATAPSRRPPSAVAAAAPLTPAAVPAARVPQRLAAAGPRGALTHPPKGGGAPSSAPRPAPPRRRVLSCACSPTTHPGSFRCALHRAQPPAAAASSVASRQQQQAPVSSGWLSAPRRASMANPLVRIAAVEGGDHIRRALASLVRPPPPSSHSHSHSHHLHRRHGDALCRRPSRLSSSSSSSAAEDVAVASP